MKKSIFTLLLPLGLVFGCSGKSEPISTMTLTSSDDKVVLTVEKSKKGRTALELSWDGMVSSNEYSILMDLEGNDFKDANVNTLGECPSKKVCMTSRELNTLIAEKWPGKLGKTTRFEFKVIASLDGGTIESNVCHVSITSYGRFEKKLYVIGSATEGGWLLGAAPEMEKGQGGIFTWKGKLTTGEVKFLTRNDMWDDFYGWGGDNQTLVYHPQGTEGDPKFQILQLGEYEIELNTIELTIDIRMVKEISARVVFLGDSITDNWDDHTTFFQDNGFINSGICGETTSQMLSRMDSQVIAYKPEVMVFLGGINDIARNQGYVSNEKIMENISTIATKAKNAGIKVVLCSILPINDIYWNKSIVLSEARTSVLDMNKRIKDCCDKQGYTFCDYYPLMSDGKGGIIASYTPDGLHPNKTGYAVMEPYVLGIINSLLGK